MSQFSRALSPRRRLPAVFALAVLLAWTAVRPAWAAEPPAAEPTGPVLTDFAAFYSLPIEEQQKPQRISVEVLILFHDPIWRVTWVRCGASPGFMSLLTGEFDLRTGDLVRVEGTAVPSAGLLVSNPRVEILRRGVPVEPLRVGEDVANTAKYSEQYVELEGYVDRQVPTGTGHVTIDLVVGTHLVMTRMQTAQDAAPLEGKRIRVRGVYAAPPVAHGGPPKMELWVQSPAELTVTGTLDDDPRFNAAPHDIEHLAVAPAHEWVRVIGWVRGQRPGVNLTVRDETGQLVALGPQVSRLAMNDLVDVIGLPERSDDGWVLRNALYRKGKALPVARSSSSRRLRLAEQVRELSSEEAQRGHRVQLSGVVTWTHPTAGFFFLQDLTGGTMVLTTPDIGPVLVGWRVEVIGTTSSGSLSPVVRATHVRHGSDLGLPDARLITGQQALTGVDDAHWVTITGYVRSVQPDEPLSRLVISTSGGEFQAVVPADQTLARLHDCVVRIRGVCRALANRKRQIEGFEVWVPAAEFIEVEEAAPSDPFSVQERSISSLRHSNTLEFGHRRVRVGGVVVRHEPGRYLFLQQGTDALLALAAGTEALAPGDVVEAVGFPGNESSRLILRDAVYRRLSSGAGPAPQSLASVRPLNRELDGRLVRLSGRLLNVTQQDTHARLVLQTPTEYFEATLPLAAARSLSLEPGSRVQLTGVYVIDFDEYKRPHDLAIEARSAADVVIEERPPWLTTRRMLVVVGVLTLSAALAAAWGVTLRRRVQLQTAQIVERLEGEKAARLDAVMTRASKLESLGVLAGGIAHDFNNLLTVIMCNLSLGQLDRSIGQDTLRCLREGEQAAKRARDLTQQLLTFAKGGAPVRSSTRMQDLIREAVEFASHGTKARCELLVRPDLWPANVDRSQISRVVQNIVINAHQAMPQGGTLTIAAQNEMVGAGAVAPLRPGKYLLLRFRDTGPGISPEQLPKIFDPYFTTKNYGSGLGLATVYSIVQQHQGHVEVQSTVGEGTMFSLWLPAAEEPPQPDVLTTCVLPQCTGRILFMDDEPSIRRLGSTMLQRMGMEVTEVANGTEALRAYASARDAGAPYDVVILDLTIPGGMGGAETLQRLRDIDPGVRAIVSSGYSSDPVMARYREHGFVAVVKKPYEAMTFAQAVQGVVAERRAPVRVFP